MDYKKDNRKNAERNRIDVETIAIFRWEFFDKKFISCITNSNIVISVYPGIWIL
jgi:hypothetical protein